ncbi:MAG TPA: DUF4870 domain-containing protein [Rhodoglobus sp.]|jgi:uncharacterized Tic20 family protein|nr:DUF4870 domain-containing protein [Rhodoglobus sp.]HOY81281.1 DUF4870 domain-containing protein [Rhodoglobus sp.]HPG76606.1 DUF4870 domain-containing protein [Rhodoglobus sp.]HQE46450.1 DUF4870 domain-containing protein [Rhodoglobus sp.]HQI66478.1 DUF4870 domain-containing protein [Rhodoglobus sp.]
MTDAPPPTVAAAPLTAAEDKLWASLAHFGGIVGILPSLIVFLVFRERGERTKQESREALNWQITFTIGWIALSIIGAIISFVAYSARVYVVGDLVGYLPLIWWIVNAVLSVLGGVKVQSGGSYRYPFALRLVK